MGSGYSQRENGSPYTDKAKGKGARILAGLGPQFQLLLNPAAPLLSPEFSEAAHPTPAAASKTGFCHLAGRVLTLVIEFFSLILYSDHCKL